MTTQVADRVVETTTTTGTGTYTLAGAKVGYRSLAQAVTDGDLADGDTVSVYVTDNVDWEIVSGVFTVATLTLTRATIARSSNAGAAVNWAAGSKDVVCNMPAAELQKLIDTSWGATTMTHTRGTLTTDLGVARRTVTLNSGATVFNVDEDDVTDTTSATETRLKSWKVGGVLKTSIRKDGALHCWNGTPTDTNYERGFMRWASNILEIGTEAAGTGTQRAMNFRSGSQARSVLTLTTQVGYDPKFTSTLDMYLEPAGGLYVTAGNGLYVTGGDAAKPVIVTNTTMSFGNYASDYTIKGHTRAVDEVRRALIVQGGDQLASATTNLDGGDLKLKGGAGASASAGDADGGHVYLDGGQGYGTGSHGDVIVGATRGNLLPGVDNTVNFGSAALGWKELFCDNGTINTSDARRKTSVSVLSVAEIAAAKDLAREIGSFKFLESVEKKGAAARTHIGMTVQRAMEIMAAHGLKPTAYSFICHDAWPDQFEQVHTNPGEKVTVKRQVTRQAFVMVPVVSENVEVIDGKPVLVKTTAEEKQLLTDPVPVLDEDGLPVMQETEDGELVPLLYAMPRMETVIEEYEDDADPVYEQVLVRAAGDKYSFRPHELLLFIVAAMPAP